MKSDKFTLPILIDGARRLHYARLENGESNPSPTFVVNLTKSKEGTLISLPLVADKKNLRAAQGYDNDVNLHELMILERKYRCTAKGNTIELQIGSSDKSSEDKLPNHIRMEEAIEPDGISRCVKIIVLQADTYKVKIQYKEFIAHLNFHVADSKDYYQVAIDFGSDCSLVGVRHQEYPIEYVYLVEELAKLYGYESEYRTRLKEDNPIFFQEDASLRAGLKSYFFIGEAKLTNDDVTQMPDRNQKVKLLAHKTDSTILGAPDKYRLIPNLKLCILDTHRLGNLKIGENELSLLETQYNIRRAILNSILYATLQHLQRHHPSSKPSVMQITLLAPNIYRQEQVDSLLRMAETDFKKIFELIVGKPQFKQVSGFEIEVLSESDAAFLGYIEKHKDTLQFTQPGAYYLTIDSGKGTTDMSLIQCLPDSRWQYQCVFRFGIAGAGNYLTFGVLEAFMQHCKLDVKPFLQSFAKAPSLSWQIQLLEALDAFKSGNIWEGKNRKITSNVAPYPTVEKTLNQRFLDEIKSKVEQIADPHKNVSIIAHRIVKMLFDEYLRLAQTELADRFLPLKQPSVENAIKLHRIFYSGRALRHPRYFQEMKTQFSRVLEDMPDAEGDRHIYDYGQTKQDALRGALNRVSGTLAMSFNSNTVATPFIQLKMPLRMDPATQLGFLNQFRQRVIAHRRWMTVLWDRFANLQLPLEVTRFAQLVGNQSAIGRRVVLDYMFVFGSTKENPHNCLTDDVDSIRIGQDFYSYQPSSKKIYIELSEEGWIQRFHDGELALGGLFSSKPVNAEAWLKSIFPAVWEELYHNYTASGMGKSNLYQDLIKLPTLPHSGGSKLKQSIEKA